MKVGDLVKVAPAKVGVFLIVGKFPDRRCASMGQLWNLYNAAEGWSLPMYEKWIEVINEAV